MKKGKRIKKLEDRVEELERQRATEQQTKRSEEHDSEIKGDPSPQHPQIKEQLN